jgi:crotonobetaine/carnitine-CoA ligase
MVSFVLAQPQRSSDREHRLRVVGANPLPPDPQAFMRRFGLEGLHVQYGSTEVPGSILAAPDDELVPGYCGRLQPGYDARLVDEHDMEVAPGTPGELILRHETPWVIAAEYLADPQATAAAWRNGWFHTGDLLKREADGRYFFVDRVKDSLRRRGENISSAEVEAQVLAFPGVKEAACVASREAGMADDEVKVWVVAEEGQAIDFGALLAFCAERMPYFMVPRFFETIDALPRTHIQRVRKMELRERGNGAATWDREAHGLRVTREGLARATG